MALGEDTGRDLWYDAFLPQFEAPDIKTFLDGPRVVEVCCMTGMVLGGHFGSLESMPPIINGWNSWELNSETTHKMTWVFPDSTDSMKVSHPNPVLADFSQMAERDLAFMLAVWDPIFELITHPTAAHLLNSMSASFAPTVKDLILWGAMMHPCGTSKSSIYYFIWRSTSMAERDCFYNRGRPLPIDQASVDVA